MSLKGHRGGCQTRFCHQVDSDLGERRREAGDSRGMFVADRMGQ
jgi:hypothetical protein